jgi:hypothetical protein
LGEGAWAGRASVADGGTATFAMGTDGAMEGELCKSGASESEREEMGRKVEEQGWRAGSWRGHPKLRDRREVRNGSGVAMALEPSTPTRLALRRGKSVW